MAPEVFFLETGFKSDVWSAGVILYEMTFGRPPYFSLFDRDQKVAAILSMMPIHFPPLNDFYLLDKTYKRKHVYMTIYENKLKTTLTIVFLFWFFF